MERPDGKRRVPAKSCPHFGRCGGCLELDKDYDEQLKVKSERLTRAFAAAGPASIPGIIASPRIHHYRHKIQLPFGMKRRGRLQAVTLGCYARDSHEVVDQQVCLIQDDELSRVAWSVRGWAHDAGLPVYNEKTRRGFLRHVLLRKGAGTGEILIGLVTNGGRPAGLRRLSATLRDLSQRALGDSRSNIVGIVQNVNTRDTNVVLGIQEFVWWGRPFITEKLGRFRFRAGLSTFLQVNPFQTPRLYDEVRRHLENGPAVLDCYCGTGGISLWIAEKARVVLGIDENPASVAAARRAAASNGVRNVRFVKGRVETELPARMDGFDIAVFDPPRRGLTAEAIKHLLCSPLQRIIYVSCDAGTLARDVGALGPAWDLVSLQGVDMFPHTGHLECVAVLDKKQS